MATDFSGANDFNILSQAPSAFVSADSSLTLRPTDRQGSPHAGVPVPTVEGATVHDKLAQNGQVNWRNLRQFRSAYTGFVEPWLRVEGRHGPALATRQCPEVSAHFEQNLVMNVARSGIPQHKRHIRNSPSLGVARVAAIHFDWRLIATHWQDMMQVVLSIQAGLVLPSMLLRKLGSHNRKSRLYLAFRELGRVERTLFLLRYVSDSQIRRTIRAETTKIESFNDFLDWITFGGPIIKSGDPVEQEKQLKYATLVANAIMLSNVADLSEVLSSMANAGHPVTAELAASTSPCMRKNLRRFGKYGLDMDDMPDPLVPKPLPFDLP